MAPVPLLALLVAAGLFAFPGTPAVAQMVQGQLTDGESGFPIEGALAILLTEAGEQVTGYLTNSAGRFQLQATGAGLYSVRIERIGYQTTTSDPFRLESGQSFGLRMETTQIAIQLEEIRVEGEQKCVVRPGEGLALASLWDEARKALTVQEWTENEGFYRFQLRGYERNLDVHARQVLSETSEMRAGVSRSPIRSLPAADLMESGFVRPTGDGGYSYFGPDASVLLSDEFLDTHCFRLALDDEQPDALGLAFEPVRLGGAPDIAGTLWLDRETAELGFLEYGYTWEPYPEARGAARGRIEFESLPSGAWIVRRWWIRMPRMVRDMSALPGGTMTGIRLNGLLEVGGEVLQATSLDDEEAVVSETSWGALQGVVWDRIRHHPLPDARVYLSGTQYSSVTDSTGQFTLTNLPEGVFTAVFTHPRLDSLRITAQGVDVEIETGGISTVELGIPFVEDITTLHCPEEAFPESTSMFMGTVRLAGDGTPVDGATVRVSWVVFQRVGTTQFQETPWSLETPTDPEGRFIACGVPVTNPLTVQAFFQDEKSPLRQVYARQDGTTRVELEIPSGRPPQLGKK